MNGQLDRGRRLCGRPQEEKWILKIRNFVIFHYGSGYYEQALFNKAKPINKAWYRTERIGRTTCQVALDMERIYSLCLIRCRKVELVRRGKFALVVNGFEWWIFVQSGSRASIRGLLCDLQTVDVLGSRTPVKLLMRLYKLKWKRFRFFMFVFTATI